MSTTEPPPAAPAETPPDNTDAEPSLAVQFAVRVYTRVVVILVIYVLSIGPMYWSWYESRYLNGDPFLAKLYYPLEVICHKLPWLGSWVDWYVDQWSG